MYVQEEDASGERAVRLPKKSSASRTSATNRVLQAHRSHDGCLPVEQILADRSCAAVCWWISAEVQKFFVDSLECHSGTPHQSVPNEHTRKLTQPAKVVWLDWSVGVHVTLSCACVFWSDLSSKLVEVGGLEASVVYLGISSLFGNVHKKLKLTQPQHGGRPEIATFQ